MEVNSYIISEHDLALNEKPLYVSYTADYVTGFLNHMHNSCEILLVESGEATYRIENEDYYLKAGDVFITSSMTSHQRTITGIPFVRYGVSILPSYLRTVPLVNEYLRVFETPSKDEFYKLKLIEPSLFNEFVQLIHSLRRETTISMHLGHEMTIALLQQIAILLVRLLGKKKEIFDSRFEYETMSEVKNHIEIHFRDNLSLSELSRKFFMQPSTISTNFKKCFGININRFINSVRISNSVILLEKREINIRDLAGMVGYNNENTFIRQFKEIMSSTPLQYRLKHIEYIKNATTKGLF